MKQQRTTFVFLQRYEKSSERRALIAEDVWRGQLRSQSENA
jgi:hypothetical protein